MQKQNKPMYRDGYIHILKEIVKKNEFNAKEKGKFFEIIVELPFNELSKRIQDKELINKFGAQLDLKIEVPNCQLNFDDKYYVIVNNDSTKVFDITYHDDTDERYYLYLAIVGVKENVVIG